MGVRVLEPCSQPGTSQRVGDRLKAKLAFFLVLYSAHRLTGKEVGEEGGKEKERERGKERENGKVRLLQSECDSHPKKSSLVYKALSHHLRFYPHTSERQSPHFTEMKTGLTNNMARMGWDKG